MFPYTRKVSEAKLYRFVEETNKGRKLFRIAKSLGVSRRNATKCAKILADRGLITNFTHRFSGWRVTPEGREYLREARMR